jgi:hypothetical protein
VVIYVEAGTDMRGYKRECSGDTVGVVGMQVLTYEITTLMCVGMQALMYNIAGLVCEYR